MVKNRLLVNCVNISLIVSLLAVTPTVHRASWVSNLVVPQAHAQGGLGDLTSGGTIGVENQQQWGAAGGGLFGGVSGSGSGGGGMLQQILLLFLLMKFMQNNKLSGDQGQRANSAGRNLLNSGQ